MQLLPLLIALVLAVLALAFVLYPLYQEQSQALPLPWPKKHVGFAGSPGDQAESTLTDREQAARMALQEIELDYQLGNIADPDYRALRERYLRRALVALKSRYNHEQEVDETQLQEMKEKNGNGEQ